MGKLVVPVDLPAIGIRVGGKVETRVNEVKAVGVYELQCRFLWEAS